MSWSAGNGRGGPVCPPAGYPPDPCGSVGAVINRPGDTAGLPAGQCTPHFLFGLARKENGPCTVQKKRALSALRYSGPPRDGGRRIGACSDFALPSGTLGSSARSILPSRGGWCGGRQGGYRIDQLLFSLPLARWLMGLLQRADEGIGPYGDAESHCPRCRGGRPRPPACIGPPRPPGQRVAKRNARKEDLVKCVLTPR